MPALNILFIAGGAGMLYLGGSLLVDGAGGLALALRVSPLVVGLTVVAFGTSAPELFVSLLAAARGQVGVSLGNVLGSNVINLALVLGLSIAIRPAHVPRSVARVDIPVMLLSYVVLVAVAIAPGGDAQASLPEWWRGGLITRGEGVVLVGLLLAYLYMLYHRPEGGESTGLSEELDPDAARERALWKDLLMIVGGAVSLALGAEGLVQGAGWLATEVLGASERFVGLAIVALGTSLPELVTTVVSLLRHESDISVGNLIGSNIFNGLMVVGATASLQPLAIGPTDYRGDVAFMVLVSLLVYAGAVLQGRLSRSLGALLLLCYPAYFGYLLMTMRV